MIRKTAEMINDKKIEGISTIRDESDRKGMRIVYVSKKRFCSKCCIKHII